MVLCYSKTAAGHKSNTGSDNYLTTFFSYGESVSHVLCVVVLRSSSNASFLCTDVEPLAA